MVFIFRQRMNDNEGAALVNFVYKKLDKRNSINPDNAATKNDLYLLQNDIHKLNIKINATKEELLKSAIAVIIAVLLFLGFIL